MAHAGDFGEAHARLELRAVGSSVDRAKNVVAVNFLNGATFLATQEHRAPARSRTVKLPAGEIGVLALEPMHDASFEERVERPVDRDRGQPRSLFRQAIEDLVCADARLG